VTGTREEVLARLDVLVGEWTIEASFPNADAPQDAPEGRCRFEWALDQQFLLQHIEIPVPEAPDTIAIISVDPKSNAYTQHYFDSRGVVRLYAMTLADGVWTLTRETSDFSPLDFRQRYIGTFSEDGDVITGAWELGHGTDWTHDFALTHRRTS
jgi:hypothetical protein